MRAQQLVMQALSGAVPLLDRGDAMACCEVYKDAAAKILAERPDPPLRDMLEAALRDAGGTTDAAQRAWQLRQTLFAVVNDESGSTFFGEGSLPLDFADPRVAAGFVAVDDRIMGGASTSRVRRVDGGGVRFEGELVVEGGGFASVRYVPPLRLPRDADALGLEARGDGRSGYKLTLRSAASDASVSYQHPLPPLDGPGFTRLRLPLAGFRASARGRPLPDAPPLVASEVRSLGFMLSRYDAGGGEKAAIPAGRFGLEVRRLSVAESELAVNSRRWVQPRPKGGA